ncbi:hypothetical protein MJO29_000954 [Puccinia striiformis f. sp. tritici]|nr:hypothetical protein Pst134EA_000950 [Puccinia striiformis f. sp. tritici]KAH9473888.1 hypothetical protein Pst134EA_000950 [Puccinia striiformis f. sp. tritici]KAI7967677.1 hypothetical protein MJO29_000954 [Puccinia striiformis f. sp. tritici]KAI9602218.1 hypothetical protein KEM48_000788 [Puccinia striiformis f. sp. tritici PST-130]
MKKVSRCDWLIVGFLLMIVECRATKDSSIRQVSRGPISEALAFKEEYAGEVSIKKIIPEIASGPARGSRSPTTSHRANSDSRLSPSPIPMKVARPQQRIKLMGIFMEPNVPSAAYVPRHETLRPCVSSKSALSLDGSATTDTLSRDSTWPPQTTKSVSNIVSEAQAANVVQNIMNLNNQETRRDALQSGSVSVGLKFDYDLFKDSPSLSEIPGTQTKFLEIFEELQLQELKLTVKQLAQKQRGFQETSQIPLPTTYSPSQKRNALNYRRYKHLGTGQDTLLASRSVWYNYWSQLDGFNSIHCTQTINSLSHPMNEVAITYLFYIEMISTIVPSQKPGENLGSQLTKALKILEEVISSVNPVSTEDPTFQINAMVHKQIAAGGSPHLFAGVWTLLEWWMKNSRIDILDELESRKKSFRVTKIFFNTIFRHTIETLKKRLEDVQPPKEITQT